jgi:prepilin-type N-terminal cleavage/methylation domain-containing protein
MRLRPLERTGQAAPRTGFTLMELLVVVAILVVLVGVATPLYLNYLEQSKKKIARADAVRLAGELKNFAVSHDGDYPPPNTWDLLPLEKKPPLDPWGQPYQWTLMETVQVDAKVMVPIVWSSGPNKISGDADDISSAN